MKRPLTLAPVLLAAAACSEPQPPPDVLVAGDGLWLVQHLEQAVVNGAMTDPEHEEWPAEAGVTRVAVGSDLCDALYLRGPGFIRFPVWPRRGDTLRYGAGLPESSAQAVFEVAVASDDGREVVDSVTLTPSTFWVHRQVDLSPWANEAVLLELQHPAGSEASIGFWANPRVCQPRPERNNVIIYLVDTLRADHLGVYGYPKPTSPAIDRWAAEGVVFEKCVAQDSRTIGSVCSLLTSLYPPTHGVDEYGKSVGTSVVTLAEAMRAAGYETASFITNVNAGVMPGLDRGFNHLSDMGERLHNKEALRTLPKEAVFGWLDAYGDQPFFAYIHTAEPHRPYTPPEEFNTFNPGYDGKITGFFDGRNGYKNAYTRKDIDQVVALYDAEIRFADDSFEELLEELDARGLRERTIIAFVADHGEELTDHGWWNHGHTLYDELVHVPLMFVGPTIPPGVRVAEPVQVIDLAPTILDLVGAPLPPSFQGDSVAALIRGQDGAHFAERDVFTTTTLAPQRTAVVQGEWKCIFNPTGQTAATSQQKGRVRKTRAEVELYDTGTDPGEARDVAGAHTEAAADFRARMQAWLEDCQSRGVDARLDDISDDDMERLRALGYVE